MNRRHVISLLGGAMGWPLAARAQQAVMPVVGYLGISTRDVDTVQLGAIRDGLKEGGFVDGRNLKIEPRWAQWQVDRLPGLAAELVRQKVDVIAVAGLPPTLAAKGATTTIPIVFQMGVDPVANGLVASLARPGGNLTGISNLNAQLGPKRLELLRELAPGANEIGLLVNPANIGSKEMVRDTRAAAEKLRVRIHVSNASVDSDLDGVFESLERLKLRALLVATDGFLIRSGRRLGELGLRHGVPTVFQTSEFAAAGGLVSYGGVLREAYHQVGVYAARILKGEKPAELPVQQSTKAEMIINLKTAKALGINVPLPLLGRADEVIE